LTKNYNKRNFHSHTFCVWKEVLFDEITTLKINYISQSGSQYIFNSDGLYRISNHWGRVANCHWRLIPLSHFKNQNTTVAFARWCDFHSNDDTSKLFFIRINLDTQEVNFYHKSSATNNERIILRNAKETAKTIRNIKEILTSNNWAKHLEYENLDVLRNSIVKELINTEKSFLEVKKAFNA
jgi:hypothetical protein